MSTSKSTRAAGMGSYLLFLLFSSGPAGVAASDEPVRYALEDFMAFAEYSEGAITADQLKSVGLERFVIVDTRLQRHFAAEHIPNAINIEWRQVLAREDEIPEDRPVVFYCDTGLLSSKAHFALRLLGYENVKVLFGGLNGWKLHNQLP